MTHHSAMRKKPPCLLQTPDKCACVTTSNLTHSNLSLQPVVQESQEAVRWTGEDDVVWRSPSVCSYSEIYERMLLLSSGPGLWSH